MQESCSLRGSKASSQSRPILPRSSTKLQNQNGNAAEKPRLWLFFLSSHKHGGHEQIALKIPLSGILCCEASLIRELCIQTLAFTRRRLPQTQQQPAHTLPRLPHSQRSHLFMYRPITCCHAVLLLLRQAAHQHSQRARPWTGPDVILQVKVGVGWCSARNGRALHGKYKIFLQRVRSHEFNSVPPGIQRRPTRQTPRQAPRQPPQPLFRP